MAKKGKSSRSSEGPKGPRRDLQKSRDPDAHRPIPNVNPAGPLTLSPETSPPFPIVAIGASAGGLQAVQKLIEALPPDTGMAFVVVMHLDPTHESMLAEILGRDTKMKVRQAEHHMPVEANHVYVNRPNTDMVFNHGTLSLSPRTELRGQHQPIDRFMRSLAEEHGFKAIGVILSGSSSDGTQGLDEIKAAGGITFAQDSTAEYSSMPRSAIASGSVDFVLPPDSIGQEIGRISRHPYVGGAASEGEEPRPREPAIGRILELLRHATGVDFANYKRNTLHRRITRRLVLNKLEGMQEYLRFLQAHPEEVQALYQDVLINVTSFFRNPDAYEALKTKVFPRLTDEKSKQEQVRVWALGCSTGEEAYSIAMAYTEFAEQTGRRIPMQIFATDLNGVGVEKARAGVYAKGIVQDVSPERLRRFFIEVDGSYRICKPIRDMCVFARQNVLADPPFSRLDLVACRNMLIYLEPVLQQRLVPMMHYALRPGGFLWLGGSETIGSFRDLFELEDNKNKIYFRKPGRAALGMQGPHPAEHRAPAARLPPLREPGLGTIDPAKEADRMLLARYAPPGVVLNADLDIVQFRGDTSHYLTPAPGRASLNLLKMLREGLLVGVRGAVHKARREGLAVREEGLRVKSNGGWREVNVLVLPVKAAGTGDGALLVMFEEPAQSAEMRSRIADVQARKAAEAAPVPPESADAEIARLKQELNATREYLQSVIEQQEAANEELQSANEEVQSANEELQSINEELETSKEEIQSSNEELATVNDELQNRNLELSQINNDLTNLIGSVQMAIIMLGPDLRIRRFTPAAEKMLNLIPADVGRPISDIKLNLDINDLDALLAEVIDNVVVREREVRDKRGHWYSLRVRPYRTLENKIDGALIVLVDVDSLKRAEETLRESDRLKNEFLATLSHELRNPLSALRNAAEILAPLPAPTPDAAVAKEVLDRQTRNMTRMVDDLLDLSRITHSRIQLRQEPCDIAQVARHAAAATEHEREAAQQALTFAAGSEALVVLGDPVRLEQIFRNLLSNASKFTGKKGQIWLSIDRERAGRRKDGAVEHARIVVRDNGGGIRADLLPHVFDMFGQGQTSPTLPATGTGMGLGLALAKRLVELHGGAIEASSQGVNKGSEFTVRLPLLPPGSVVKAIEPAGKKGRPRRILIVDDNQDAAKLLARVLIAAGHEVRTAHDGTSVMDAMREYRPEAVLLDLGLPDVDGYTVAKQIRAEPSFDSVLLVAVSGFGRAEDVERGRKVGIDEHLVKPVDQRMLEELLSRLPGAAKK